MSAPRVAILMPAYNAAAYLENTVRSILRQSFTDLLLICSLGFTATALFLLFNKKVQDI